MGIKTVAVYSGADKGALHVELADEAVHIGPPPAASSYLLIDKIVQAALDSGAQAVHPGYGFLSENPDFANALEKAGITFIGPGTHAIKVMGDKITSKKFAKKAGVNIIPGCNDVIKDTAHARKVADAIGYPVMIKASAGGGGKGMRVAWSQGQVEEGFNSSKSEAASSFGDDRIFIEKFIERPRHIEIQILADSHGNIVHLFERECSIQRRNQKVIEEAPSSFLDDKTRQAMGAQAVALAKAVSYQSAGTVEFIVDKARNFYFLEMNTRLQVEHPVTEMITGLDLVEKMILIAAGEELGLAQKDIAIDGWAIEARIYAEDPLRGFLPSTGRLVRYSPPAQGQTAGGVIRNDTGVYEGGEISVHYDPMIAKLVTHAATREQATALLGEALDRFHIDGISHNIPFLSALLHHERWQSGDLSTDLIAREYPDGFVARTPSHEEYEMLACIAASIDHVSNSRRRRISDQMGGEKVRFARRRIVALGERTLTVIVSGKFGRRVKISLLDENERPSRSVKVRSNWWPGEAVWTGSINKREISVQLRPVLNGYELSCRGISLACHVYTVREAQLAALMPLKLAPDTSNMLLCPMPGLLSSLAVGEGELVKSGQTLCVVEAMKMENILRAARDGRVAKINVAVGDILASDDVIMEFDLDRDQGGS